MTLRLTDKQVIVAEVAEVAAKSVSAVAAFYSGLTVEQMTNLRVQARGSKVYLRVVRNTLARKALENTDFACLKEKLVGPMILAFSKEEPSSAARLMRDFAKENKKLEIKALVVSGQLMEADQLEAVASLPTYSEAISQLMSVMQAPMGKIVRILSAVPTKLVRTVVAVAEQKKAA